MFVGIEIKNDVKRDAEASVMFLSDLAAIMILL